MDKRQELYDWQAMKNAYNNSLGLDCFGRPYPTNEKGCYLTKGRYQSRLYKGVLTQITHILLMEENNWEEWPKGMVAMHLCDEPRCVNPSHLQAGTPQENQMYSTKKDASHIKRYKSWKWCQDNNVPYEDRPEI